MFSTGQQDVSSAGSVFVGQGYQSSSEVTAMFVVPVTGTMKTISVHMENDAGDAVGEGFVYTVFNNSVPTGLTCTVLTGTDTCSMSTDAGFAAGDLLSIEVKPIAASTTSADDESRASVSLVFSVS